MSGANLSQHQLSNPKKIFESTERVVSVYIEAIKRKLYPIARRNLVSNEKFLSVINGLSGPHIAENNTSESISEFALIKYTFALTEVKDIVPPSLFGQIFVANRFISQ